MAEDNREVHHDPFNPPRRQTGGETVGEARRQETKPEAETYVSLKRRLRDPRLENDERREINQKIERIVDTVEDVQDGKYIRSLRFRIQDAVKHMEWDEVYPRLLEMATQEEDSFQGKHFFEPEMGGVLQDAIEATAAKVAIAGIRQKRDTAGLSEDWLALKGYDDRILETMVEDANQRDFFNIIPGRPEDLVSASLGRHITSTPLTPPSGVPFDAREFARAMGVASPEQQRQLYLRGEEMMFPIQMAIEVPSFLLSDDERQRIHDQELWLARSKASVAASKKKDAPSFDKLFPNEEVFNFTKRELMVLLGYTGERDANEEFVRERRGSLEALSAYALFIGGNEFLQGRFDVRDYLQAYAQEGEEELIPSSFYEIKDGRQLLAVRKAMRGFLVNQLGIDPNDARDAEQIAWIQVYLSNMVDHYDSRQFRPGGTKRLPPIQTLKSLPTWMMMHPQERWEAKVKSNDEWGAFGPWAVRNVKRGKWRTNENNFILPDVLPSLLLPNAFQETVLIKLEGAENDARQLQIRNRMRSGIGEILDTRKVTMQDLLIENGRRLILENRDDMLEIPWDGGSLSDTPFSGYHFDGVSPAILIFSIINSGGADKRLSDIGTAARKLNLPRKYRENILMVLYGFDPKSTGTNPKPIGMLGGMGWNDYLRGVKKWAPNFFD